MDNARLDVAKHQALKAWHALDNDRFSTDAGREAHASILKVLIALKVIPDCDHPMPIPCQNSGGGICYLRRCYVRGCWRV